MRLEISQSLQTAHAPKTNLVHDIDVELGILLLTFIGQRHQSLFCIRAGPQESPSWCLEENPSQRCFHVLIHEENFLYTSIVVGPTKLQAPGHFQLLNCGLVCALLILTLIYWARNSNSMKMHFFFNSEFLKFHNFEALFDIGAASVWCNEHFCQK